MVVTLVSGTRTDFTCKVKFPHCKKIKEAGRRERERGVGVGMKGVRWEGGGGWEGRRAQREQLRQTRGTDLI